MRAPALSRPGKALHGARFLVAVAAVLTVSLATLAPAGATGEGPAPHDLAVAVAHRVSLLGGGPDVAPDPAVTITELQLQVSSLLANPSGGFRSVDPDTGRSFTLPSLLAGVYGNGQWLGRDASPLAREDQLVGVLQRLNWRLAVDGGVRGLMRYAVGAYSPDDSCSNVSVNPTITGANDALRGHLAALWPAATAAADTQNEIGDARVGGFAEAVSPIATEALRAVAEVALPQPGDAGAPLAGVPIDAARIVAPVVSIHDVDAPTAVRGAGTAWGGSGPITVSVGQGALPAAPSDFDPAGTDLPPTDPVQSGDGSTAGNLVVAAPTDLVVADPAAIPAPLLAPRIHLNLRNADLPEGFPPASWAGGSCSPWDAWSVSSLEVLYHEALPPVISTCPLPQTFRLAWRSFEKVDAILSARTSAATTAWRRDVKRAIAAITADLARHPSHRVRDRAELAYLRRLLAHPPVAPRPRRADVDLSKLSRQAVCTMLGEARDATRQYLVDHGHEDRVELAETFLELRDTLEGTATDGERRAVLRANVTALVERLGGKGAATTYAGVINDAYDLAAAKLDGTLTATARAKLQAAVLAKVKAASKKWFGRDAPVLVDQLLTLRDVLAGDQDPAKQAEVLRASVTGLATRLLGEGVLQTPQARAAMFGFELGTAFGKSIAADLQVVANQTLSRECAAALVKAQGASGVPDYSRPTIAHIAKPGFHAGWECAILPGAFVTGVAGGIVQATRPANASIADKLLWRVTTSGAVVEYDPSFSG